MKRKVLVVFLIFFSSRIFACDCAMLTLKDYAANTPLIITGKVVKIITPPDSTLFFPSPQNRSWLKNTGSRVSVLVLERLKTGGVKADTLVFTSEQSGCDPLYRLEESYLFFAEQKVSGGDFRMLPCTPGGTLNQVSNQLDFLRKAIKKNSIKHARRK